MRYAISRRLPNRVTAAWNILRGRPTIYGLGFIGPVWLAAPTENLLISNVLFEAPDKRPERWAGMGDVLRWPVHD